MEWTGIPIDAELLGRIRSAWAGIKRALVAEVDSRFGIYDGLTFKTDRFAAYLAAHGIPWPRLESGTLALDDDTFRDMARSYPQLQPLRELRHALGELRLEALAVGRDGRNRCLLSRLPLPHRPQPAEQRAVRLRPGDLGAQPDPAGARPGARLCRLQLAGDGDRCGPERRWRADRRLPVRATST